MQRSCKTRFVEARLTLIIEEFKKLANSSNFKKSNLERFNQLSIELKNKWLVYGECIHQRIFNAYISVLQNLLKKSMDSQGNPQTILVVLEVLGTIFTDEAKYLAFLNTISIQDSIVLLFNFFLKKKNSYHKQFLDFCRRNVIISLQICKH